MLSGGRFHWNRTYSLNDALIEGLAYPRTRIYYVSDAYTFIAPCELFASGAGSDAPFFFGDAIPGTRLQRWW